MHFALVWGKTKPVSNKATVHELHLVQSIKQQTIMGSLSGEPKENLTVVCQQDNGKGSDFSGGSNFLYHQRFMVGADSNLQAQIMSFMLNRFYHEGWKPSTLR